MRKDSLLDTIDSFLLFNLDQQRYQHTIGVAYTAAALAMAHGTDVSQARLAGLLHDCGKQKYYRSNDFIRVCRTRGLPLDEDKLRAPQVIHGFYSAWLAQHRFGITDHDILNAVSWHTTGRPAMSQLEQIIFIADYIEPMRYQQERLGSIRRTAFASLDQACAMILADTIRYLSRTGTYIDSNTLKAYEYYRKFEGEK